MLGHPNGTRRPLRSRSVDKPARHPWLKSPGIQANTNFIVRDHILTVSLTDHQRGEIKAGREQLWLFGCVWFKDWFDIRRKEEFLLRWKTGAEPGDPSGARVGFIVHDDAQ